jgi:glycosyltransferase involved in cell wall biosynthesis
MNIKFFLFPNYNPHKDKSGNPYLNLLTNALSEIGELRNRQTSKFGFASILFNLDARIFILNWTESIPFKPFGFFQTLFFPFGMLILKITNKKIVWIAHNKQSHYKNSIASRFCMWITAKYATKTIVHASEGIDIFRARYRIQNIKFIPHPAYSQARKPIQEAKYDFIIWGSIDRRKQVLEFVQFARNRPFYQNKKILICGRPQDEAYRLQLIEACSGFCELRAEFISESMLDELLGQSRSVLFTYKDENTLGSSALICSLNFGKPIIGPNSGAFADMPGIVQCYDRFEDIETMSLANNEAHPLTQAYLKKNTWEGFAKALLVDC